MLTIVSLQVKYVPEWFPGAGFQRKAREWRFEVDRVVDAPFAAMRVCGWFLELSFGDVFADSFSGL